MVQSYTKNPKRAHSPRTWPFLRCCPFADHLGLLAELEYASTDPDIAALLPRARVLLAGRTDTPAVGPWWSR